MTEERTEGGESRSKERGHVRNMNEWMNEVNEGKRKRVE
jgi:hypothetical protein